MSVTDGDRSRATAAISQYCEIPWDLFEDPEWVAVDAIARLLADERERARAPFLALAAEWDETSARYARIAKMGDRSELIASLSGDAAMRIRRAVEDGQ